MELILATRNTHKVAEVSRLLAPFRITVVPLSRDVQLPPEDGETFSANALPKARAAARHLKRPVIADDSGIEAAALDGVPGVRSARYAGQNATDAENLRKLILEVPVGGELRYVCALAFSEGVTERVFYGECRGHMSPAPRGDHGFGYDPVFIPDESPDRTMAELQDSEKDLISHRGKAVRDFAWWFLGERLGLRR
ncbi:MAG TPA: RdgB/HAM1 family non-canonical purine NTP pyrophosphatase [Solirubrobacteraceae bacterium]|jgi:XTP/dITP diphosphohydrolase|nr:RdgB/HAM1 family non-canonical purine NTP pyrophosphatase [Solirubrobacteraceae bacterium]